MLRKQPDRERPVAVWKAWISGYMTLVSTAVAIVMRLERAVQKMQ